MRIAIVDDISEERTLLRNRLESQFSRRNVHVDIFEYENGETFLTAAKECPFTVVFLDIYMNGSNGIDTAKELRRSDTDCLLIFTTTSTDHALEGFQVRALHYLVKPYSENDISVLAASVLTVLLLSPWLPAHGGCRSPPGFLRSGRTASHGY